MKHTMNPISKLLGALACGAMLWAGHARADGHASMRAAVAVERARPIAPRQPREAFFNERALIAVRLSPALRTLCLSARQWFATPNPLAAGAIPPPPRHIVVLAAGLCLLSLLAAIWLSRRQVHAPVARWTWVLACGVIGVPALISLWLLFPGRERVEALPLAHPAAV